MGAARLVEDAMVKLPVGCCALLALGVTACGSDAAPEAAADAQGLVALASVDTVTVNVPLSIPAQLYVEHDALVYARSMGIVETVDADVGSRVRQGQVLARLESIDQEIALAEAEHIFNTAEVIVNRLRELGGKGVVSAADSEQAELEYQRARLARRQAQRNYDLTRVTAPFNGIVAARTIHPGRLVVAGDSLFRVTAMAPLLISVRVPEISSAAIERGAEAEVVGLDGQRARATVSRVSPAVDAASGTREVILRLEAGSGLPPGASVTVRLAAEPRTVLTIPADAATEEGYVLVWENGRSALRAVTLGSTLDDGRRVVVSGLAVGEQVVRRQT